MKIISGYVVFSLAVLIFGAVYEYFSHEVYSGYMLYAFVIPLVLGVTVFFFLMKYHAPYPDLISECLYTAGIATLTTASMLSGVLEIYGTENSKVLILWILGIVLCIAGVIVYATLSRMLFRYRKKEGTRIKQ